MSCFSLWDIGGCGCETPFNVGSCGQPLPGATVQVYDSTGTTLIETQTSDSAGTAKFTTLAPGTAYKATVTPPSSRLKTSSGIAVTGGTTNGANLDVAAGYWCIGHCAIPAAATLHATIGGTARTLTNSNATSWVDPTGQYIISQTGDLSLPTGTDCPPTFDSCPPALSISYSCPDGTAATATE